MKQRERNNILKQRLEERLKKFMNQNEKIAKMLEIKKRRL